MLSSENSHSRVRGIALAIRAVFTAMAADLDRICAATCPACRENCCARATVWYDTRDLLYLKFSNTEMPEAQLSRVRTAHGRVCVNLTDTGCRLLRHARPFICTWYFCPLQKPMAERLGLQGRIEDIKTLRQGLDQNVCQII